MRTDEDTRQRPTTSRRRALVLGLLLGTVLAGLVAAERPIAASEQQPGTVSCEPDLGEPVLENLGGADVLAVPYAEGARCTWTIRLAHAGRLPVTITEVAVAHDPDWDGLLTFDRVMWAGPLLPDDPPEGHDLVPMRPFVLDPGREALIGLSAVMDNCEQRSGELGTEFHHTWPVRYRVLGLIPRTSTVRIEPHLGVTLDGASCRAG